MIDLDVDRSPTLCHNVLKLAKARYYTNTLIYNVQPGRFCQMGDPMGDGSGGCSIYGLIDATLEHHQKQKQNQKKGSASGSGSKMAVDVRKSQKRFLRSKGHGELTKEELCEKGRVVVTNMGNVENTIGSQFLITVDSGPNRALDGIANDTGADNDSGNNRNDSGGGGNEQNGPLDKKYFSLGQVAEDDNDVLSQINNLYCDKSGRPYTDVRIIRMHVLDDPYNDDDPEGMDKLLQKRGVSLMDKGDLPEQYAICSNWVSCSSPIYEKPDEEIVVERIKYEDAMVDMYNEDGEVVVDAEKERKRQEEMLKKEDKSNAVILEMLGDIASADAKPPENVLFVCKLNPMTEDEVRTDYYCFVLLCSFVFYSLNRCSVSIVLLFFINVIKDLQLIFSRFDPDVKAEIIRDPDTGNSLQYAFVEFETKEACTEAYFKMNNALIDDRRIKVDFSQSVAKEWNRYTQRKRHGGHGHGGERGGNNNFSYRDNRANYHNKPKQEKKYYGGYKQQNQTANARSEYSEGTNRDHHRSDKVDERSRRGERDNYDDRKRRRSLSLSDASAASSSSSYRSKDRDSAKKRKSGHSRDRHRRHDRDRHHKKRKHKHRSRHRDDDGGDDRDRRDRHKSSKRKHKSSSRRKRSRSRDRESSRRRHRSRSISN